MTDQSTRLLMVEPVAFGFNAETATTNRFQQRPTGALDVTGTARAEFRRLATALQQADIDLAIAADTGDPVKPDAVFPNNWVSFHADGTVVLYPMRDPTRRAERREAVIDTVKAALGFREARRIDLTEEERHGRYLEGTGSLVLDHRARVAYACRSPRTDEALVREWCRLMGFEPFLFDAATPDGTPVYHTNVVLWIGQQVVGIGLAWIPTAQQHALRERLGAGGRQLMPLDDAQLRSFAGNMLEVSARDGRRHLVMSASAAAALNPAQQAQLRNCHSLPLVAAVPVIEHNGGGSVRCMLAEVPVTGARP